MAAYSLSQNDRKYHKFYLAAQSLQSSATKFWQLKQGNITDKNGVKIIKRKKENVLAFALSANQPPTTKSKAKKRKLLGKYIILP